MLILLVVWMLLINDVCAASLGLDGMSEQYATFSENSLSVGAEYLIIEMSLLGVAVSCVL